MINLEKLSEAAEKIKNREVEGLENLYLLTYKDTYSDIRSFIEDDDEAWDILFDVYIQVWKRAFSIPDANIIKLWIRVIIKALARKEGITEVGDFASADISEYIRLEERAAAVLIEIEEELGLFEVEEEEYTSRKNRKLKKHKTEYNLTYNSSEEDKENKTEEISALQEAEEISPNNETSKEIDKEADEEIREEKSKDKSEPNIKNKLSVAEKRERRKQRRKKRRANRDKADKLDSDKPNVEKLELNAEVLNSESSKKLKSSFNNIVIEEEAQDEIIKEESIQVAALSKEDINEVYITNYNNHDYEDLSGENYNNITAFPDDRAKEKDLETELKNELKYNTVLDLENMYDEEQLNGGELGDGQDVQLPSFFRVCAAALATGIAIAIIIYIIDVVKEDNSIHTFASNIIEKSMEQDSDAIITGTIPEDSNSGAWLKSKDGQKYKYMKSDGRFKLEEWLEENGKLYYFDDTSYMVTGEKRMGSQSYTFDKNGALTSIKLNFIPEDKNTALSNVFREIGAEAFSRNIVMDSVAYGSEWIYFLYITDSDPNVAPALMRINNTSHSVEKITDKVEGYIVLGDSVWYYKEGSMQMFSALDSGANISEQYTIRINQGLYSMIDGIGRIVDLPKGQTKLIGDREYTITDSIIRSIKPAVVKPGERELKFDPSNSENIYNIDDSVFLNVPGGVSAACVKRDLLYYAQAFEDNGRINTSIYTVDINTGKKEAVREKIKGEIKSLYYYSEYDEIYAEYAPLGKQSPYTQIILIDKDDKVNIIGNSTGKPDNMENIDENLAFIGIEGDKVYCYRNKVKFGKDGITFTIEYTSALILDKRQRLEIK